MRDALEIATRLMVAIDTPRSLTVSIMIRYEMWDDLTSLSVNPLLYDDRYPEKYLSDVQATDFLRKCEGFPIPGKHLKKEAEERFFSLERKNKRTNIRLNKFVAGILDDSSDVRIANFFDDVKNLVSRVLGPLPESLDFWHGPGGTFYDRGTLITVPDKMSSLPAITREARILEPLFTETAWARAERRSPHGHLPFRVVRGDRFTTVPKDARKRRGICIQPSFNISAQLGVGRVMRSRLRRVGIDLREGQEWHKRVACAASLSGENATLDLSDASDTICTNLIRLCVPQRWLEVLDCLRTPMTLVGSKWVLLEKFSAMGNGYTFELETLVFLALATVACGFTENDWGWRIMAYGDDLIVPTTRAEDVLSVLRFCGLEPNRKKTFITGSFRESCGGDYLKGVDVRPHYLKEFPYEPQHYIALANGIRRFIKRLQVRNTGRVNKLIGVWHFCLDKLPSHIRACRGPEYLGDLLIQDEERHWAPITGDNQIRSFRCFLPVSQRLGWEHWRRDVVLASALYGCESTGVTPRGAVQGYRMGWVPALETAATRVALDLDKLGTVVGSFAD